MKLLLCMSFIIAGASTVLACGSTPPPPPPATCPAGYELKSGKYACSCWQGRTKWADARCPTGYTLGNPFCKCSENKKTRMENGEKSCGSVIQELTFKNSIGCINCATEFCLQKKNFSLQEAVKDEMQCNTTLECLRAHGKKCGCVA